MSFTNTVLLIMGCYYTLIWHQKLWAAIPPVRAVHGMVMAVCYSWAYYEGAPAWLCAAALTSVIASGIKWRLRAVLTPDGFVLYRMTHVNHSKRNAEGNVETKTHEV